MGWIAGASKKVLPFQMPLRTEFPPKALYEPQTFEQLSVSELEARTKRLRKLENLYHKGQKLAWDGKQVLADLVEKHGKVDLPDEHKKAIGQIFSIILWGELGAWEVSSFLAENIRDNTEAKMAATIQTFDEARHYYVMRDYLDLLEIELPPPNAFVKTMLSQLLATDSVLYKLVGMQLFVEHIAVHLFRTMSELKLEPILSELLVYFHRDEARHVALGKLYLPVLLKDLSRRQAIQLQAYQLWLITFMQFSIEYHRDHAETLGMDIGDAMRRALRDQTSMLEDIKTTTGVRGVVLVPKRLRFVNRWLIKNLWAKDEGAKSTVLSNPVARRTRQRLTNVAERAWARVA